MGLCPPYLKGQHESFMKFLSTMIPAMLFFLSIYTTVGILNDDLPGFTTFDRLVSASTVFVFAPLFASKTVTNLFSQVACEEILVNLRQFDEKCVKEKRNSVVEERAKNISFFLSRIILICYSSLDVFLSILFSDKTREYNIITYIPFELGLFYVFSIVTFTWELFNTLRPRYKYINDRIRKVVILGSNKEMSHRQLQDEIRNIKFLYECLSTSVNTINGIFGLATLTVFIYIQAAVLVCLFWMCLLISNDLLFFDNAVFITVCTVSVLYRCEFIKWCNNFFPDL